MTKPFKKNDPMKTKIACRITLVALCCGITSLYHVVAQGADVAFNFDSEEAGKLPPDWTPAVSTWMIALDGTNKAMKQTGKSEGDRFNICVQNKLKYLNLEIEVRIKPLDGEEDQGGGLVWRYQDAKNYYITRANPLENNFRVYKVVNGNRKQMKSANIKMQKGEWYNVKVVVNGNSIDCYYNGQKLLSHSDETFPNQI